MSWLMRSRAWCVIVVITVSCGSDDGDDDARGAGGLAGASGGSGEGGAAGSGEGGSAGALGGASCVDQDALSVIAAHVEQLELTADLLSGHASEREAVGFLLAPGLGDAGLGASFASLFEPCQMAMQFVEFCDAGHCSQLECTGEGTGWANRYRLESPTTVNDFSFQTAEARTEWSEGATGVTFTLDVAATGPGGRDWSMNGSGSMDVSSLNVTETYPGLFTEGSTTLEVASAPESLSGTLTIEGVVVARLGADNRFVATGDCPPE